MAIFTISDLHLPLSAPEKTMEVFSGWTDYVRRLEENWRRLVSPEDTVVVGGDISWAMQLERAEADFRFLDSLPGRKLLMKGNHDYWWSTRKKMEAFFASKGLTTLEILHNNAVEAEGLALCGSRGWIFENGAAADQLVIDREAGRIRMSLEAAPEGLERILFLHYPPVYCGQQIPAYLNLMKEFGVRRCYYGHLHGPSVANAYVGDFDGIALRLVSADYLRFCPMPVPSQGQEDEKRGKNASGNAQNQ